MVDLMTIIALGVILHYQLNHIFDSRDVKVLGAAVVVGGSRNHHKIGIAVSVFSIQGFYQIKFLFCQVFSM